MNYTLSKTERGNMSLQALQLKVQKNKKYRTLMETFKNNRLFNLKLDKLQEEILTLHTARQVKNLINFTQDGSSKLIDQVVKANIIDQGQRSRLTEIMLGCKRASCAVEDSIKIFKDYALIKWDAELRAFKTKGERENAIKICLHDMLEYQAAADTVFELSKLVVNDIDQAGFALKRIIDAVSLHHTPERRL
jgi:hypothetical protein